ncbi:hypothetical protein [Pedobacter aquatilis]|uniref:hypothetical protein n=1 Tax=Pedobacter aquatilis TaxID=351343 RepID=UPI0029306CEA|nr:hypothetical protein [Pedobacter aquatilis]
MKFLSASLFLFFAATAACFSQNKVSRSYLDTASAYFETARYAKALIYYEKGIQAGDTGNYTYYRASQSACKSGDEQKAIAYGERSFSKSQDFYNYEYFASDSLNSCFRNSAAGKSIIAALKTKYDAWQLEQSNYISSINDSTKRIRSAALSSPTKAKEKLINQSPAQLKQWIKNFNAFPVPPVKDHWTLYHITVRDTIKMPFLLYIPKNYNPAKKHFLYVYLHGAATRRKQFYVNSMIPKWEKEVLMKPLQEGAIILYAFARQDINWVDYQDAFSAIEQEIVLTKSLYNIDDNRVYVGGHSDGGRGAFGFALNKPSLFAAMYGVCYFPSLYSGDTFLANLRNGQRFYGISADDDELFPAKRIEPVYDMAKSIGANWENYTLKGDHGLPTESPEATFFIYDLLFKQQRNPFPQKINWETDDISNGRNAWIEITALDTLAEKKEWQKEYSPILTQNGKTVKANFYKRKSGAIVAEANGNNINISASRVKKIRLYLSPDMFDFNQQLKVRINDKDFINIKLAQDKTIMLSEFEKTKDRAFIVGQYMDLTIN